MKIATKKCQLCAEEIPLAAVTCKYCGAHFIVTSTGYCQNCHQVREADGEGQCKVCGNALTDLRVESRLIEAPVQGTLSASQSIAQPERTKSRKSRLPVGILAGILLLSAIGAFLLFRRNSAPVTPSLLATSTPTIATAFTQNATQPATPTYTPRPTQTSTPIPAWVTSFAEPILAAIANTSPHFEDDFSQASDGWRVDQRDDRCRVKIQDGAFTMSAEAGREMAWCSNSGLRFGNFVLRVEIDLSESGLNDSAQIGWHGITPYHQDLTFSLFKDGNWEIYFCSDSSCTAVAAGRQAGIPPKVTVTIISKGKEYAIYIDEIPIKYVKDMEQHPGLVITLGFSALNPSRMIKYDNLKIWNLDYIDLTSATVPTTTDTPSLTSPTTPDQRVLNPANQHLYLYVKTPLAWHEARDYCVSQGGHLVTIQAPSENRFVYDLATKYNTQVGTWLGGTDEAEEGTWVWVTGEPWNYWNWDKNSNGPQPDDKRGDPNNNPVLGADFLMFNYWDRTWHDSDDEQHYFVCEWEP